MDIIDNSYEKESLSQIVVKYVEDKILFGDFQSGDKISEYDVSKELSVSRAPIREAFKELQMKGLLDFQPRKGCRVISMSREDIDEIFDIRISLEKDIIKIFLEKNYINSDHIHVLEEKANHMFNMANVKDNEKRKIYILNQLDIDFHSYLWNLAKSPRRASMLRSLFIQLLAAMNKNTATLGKIEEKAKEHYDLIQIFKNKDIPFAHEKIEEHINHYREELYNIL